MTIRRDLNIILAQVLLCAVFLSTISAATSVFASAAYTDTNTPFNTSSLTFKDANTITDGTYNFVYSLNPVNAFTMDPRNTFTNAAKDNRIYTLQNGFPSGFPQRGGYGTEVRYLIAVSKAGVLNAYQYTGDSNFGWQMGQKLNITNASIVPRINSGEVTIRSALAGTADTEVNAGVFTFYDNIKDLITGGNGNGIKLSDTDSGAELVKIPFASGSKTITGDLATLALTDQKVTLNCPGKYNFSYSATRWAPNTSLGTNTAGGSVTDNWNVNARLDFSVDDQCLVTIDPSDTIGIRSPIRNKYLWSGAVTGEMFYIPITAEKVNALNEALTGAAQYFASWVQASLKWVMGGIQKLLGDTADYVIGRTDGTSNGMLGPWTAMRNVGLTLLVMALIIIAFANVLQIDIEQYGMNRMIPKIIISIIMAFLSWVIVTFFFDFTKAIQDQAVTILTNGGDAYGGIKFLQDVKINTNSVGGALLGIGDGLLLLVILVGTLVCGVVLFFTLIMRIVMLCFLLAVAPLAFILNIVPFTANLYKQWWTEFWKWMFMGPVALIIIALGAIIADSATKNTDGTGALTAATTIGVSDTNGKLLIGLIIFAASMYVAATLPLQWGGKIMQGWGKAGKWGRDNIGIGSLKGKYLKQGWQDFNKSRADRGTLKYSELRANLANKVPGGRFLTGTSKAQASALKEGIDKTYEGMFGKLDATELARNAKAGGRKGMIATKVMQDKYGDGTKAWALPGQVNADGTWNTNDPIERDNWDKASKAAANESYSKMMAEDRDFVKSTIEDNPEMALNVARSMQNSNPQLASSISGEVNSINAGKSWSQKNRKQVGAITDDFEQAKKDHANNWGAISTVARSSDKPEVRTKALMDMGLNSYEAGQVVTAADMRKSWDEQARSHDRILANADDKRRGTILGFESKVRFDSPGPTDSSPGPTDPSDNYQI